MSTSTSRVAQLIDDALHYLGSDGDQFDTALAKAKEYHKGNPIKDGILNTGQSASTPAGETDVSDEVRRATLEAFANDHRKSTAQPFIDIGIPLPLALELVDRLVL